MRLVDILQPGRSVAATWQAVLLLLSELPGVVRFQLQGIAPNWVLLATEGSGEHLPVAAIGALRAVGDGILLAGYSADESEGLMTQLESGCNACLALEESLDVTLFWQVEEDAAPGGWAISVRASAGGK